MIEVLSPSTRSRDFADKLPDYKSLPSVVEIWLIDGEVPLDELYLNTGL